MMYNRDCICRVPRRSRSDHLHRWQAALRDTLAVKREMPGTGAFAGVRSRIRVRIRQALAWTQTLTNRAEGPGDLSDAHGDWGDVWWSRSS